MISALARRSETWLNTPIQTDIGSLLLAGELENNRGIDPDSMRILGRYGLILMLDGSGVYRDLENGEIPLATGDAVVVFPEIAHAYGPRVGQGWKHSYIVFEGPQFDLLRRAGALDPAHPVWPLGSSELWKQRLKEVTASAAPNSPSALRAVVQFAHLLSEMSASRRANRQRPDELKIEEGAHLLSGPIQDAWLTPQDAARQVGMSYENFRKRFAKHMGEPPALYQKRRRIGHACAAIYQNTDTFQEIADQLGFCDVFHFSKVFRQLTGESPSAFRKRALGE